MLCAAPLVSAPAAYEAVQPAPVVETAVVMETLAAAEPAYLGSMGCYLTDCTDSAHYHHCAADCAVAEHYHDCYAGCTDPAHYHDCYVGCTDPTHPHSNQCWETETQAGPTFCPSMGCALEGCTDPAHYHGCPEDCAVAGHYHDCPVGCAAHFHGGYGYGHGHGRGRGRHGGHHC